MYSPADLIGQLSVAALFGAGVAWGAFGSRLQRHDEMIGNGKPGVFVRTEAMAEWRALVTSWREGDAERMDRLEATIERLALAVETQRSPNRGRDTDRA